MLQACLNGGRTRSECAHTPITPNEIANSAREAVAAGAVALHVHPRDRDGLQSLAPEDVAACLSAVRTAVPGIPLGIGTGDWITPRSGTRHQEMMRWSVQPDYVSINLCEEDAPEVMAVMTDMGIGIEAGLWSVADTKRYLSLTLPEPVRLLIEMPDTAAELAQAEARAVLALLIESGNTAPILLHGMDRSAWPCLEQAATLGHDSRVGLEDMLLMPDGSAATGNGPLVGAAVDIFAKAGASTT